LFLFAGGVYALYKIVGLVGSLITWISGLAVSIAALGGSFTALGVAAGNAVGAGLILVLAAVVGKLSYIFANALIDMFAIRAPIDNFVDAVITSLDIIEAAIIGLVEMGKLGLKAVWQLATGDISGAKATYDALKKQNEETTFLIANEQRLYALRKQGRTQNTDESKAIQTQLSKLVDATAALEDKKTELERELIAHQKTMLTAQDVEVVAALAKRLEGVKTELAQSVIATQKLRQALKDLGLSDADIKVVTDTIDANAVKGRINTKLREIDTGIQEAKKKLGLDKITILENGLVVGLVVPEKESQVLSGMKGMLDEFNKIITEGVKGPERSWNKLIETFTDKAWTGAVGAGIRGAVDQIKSLAGLVGYIESLDTTWRVFGDRVVQTRLTAAFKRDKAGIEELGKSVEGTTGYLKLYADAVNTIRSVEEGAAARSIAIQEALLRIGVSAEDAAKGFAGLKDSLREFESDQGAIAAAGVALQQLRVQNLVKGYEEEKSRIIENNRLALETTLKAKTNEKDRDAARVSSALALNAQLTDLNKKTLESYKKELDGALKAWESYEDKVKQGEKALRDMQRSAAEQLAALRQSMMTPYMASIDASIQASEKADRYAKDMQARQFLDAKETASQIAAYYQSVAQNPNTSWANKIGAISSFTQWTDRAAEAQNEQNLVNEKAAEINRKQAESLVKVVEAMETAVKELGAKTKAEIELLLDPESIKKMMADAAAAADAATAAMPKVLLKVDLDQGAWATMVEKIKNGLSSIKGVISIDYTATRITRPLMASGGPIFGPGTGTSDEVPFWGSNGEFVMRARAVKAYGMDFMYAINDMMLPRTAMPAYASGGPITSPSGGSSYRDVVDVNFNIGGQRISLMGERTQVRRLVSTLKNLEGV